MSYAGLYLPQDRDQNPFISPYLYIFAQQGPKVRTASALSFSLSLSLFGASTSSPSTFQFVFQEDEVSSLLPWNFDPLLLKLSERNKCIDLRFIFWNAKF